MKNYLEHPNEEVLERFVLNQSGDEELDVVETHILACDSCVARLETLEVEIAATKLALQQIHLQLAEQNHAAHQQTAARSKWFSLPRLSAIGAAAAIAIGIMLAPHFGKHGNDITMAQVTLMAYRGIETPVVPKDKPLHMFLNAEGLDQNSVAVRLVDGQGAQLWKGTAEVHQNRAAVDLPKIAESGTHIVQLYAPQTDNEANGQPNGEPRLLREFSFDVK